MEYSTALHISNITIHTAEMDAGVYSCSMLAGNHNISSQRGVVTIFVLPSFEDPQCSMLTNNTTGSNAIMDVAWDDINNLSCSSLAGVPKADLTWTHCDEMGSQTLLSSLSEVIDGTLYATYTWKPERSDPENVTFACTLTHPGLVENRSCTLGPFGVVYVSTKFSMSTSFVATSLELHAVLPSKSYSDQKVANTTFIAATCAGAGVLVLAVALIVAIIFKCRRRSPATKDGKESTKRVQTGHSDVQNTDTSHAYATDNAGFREDGKSTVHGRQDSNVEAMYAKPQKKSKPNSTPKSANEGDHQARGREYDEPTDDIESTQVKVIPCPYETVHKSSNDEHEPTINMATLQQGLSLTKTNQRHGEENECKYHQVDKVMAQEKRESVRGQTHENTGSLAVMSGLDIAKYRPGGEPKITEKAGIMNVQHFEIELVAPSHTTSSEKSSNYEAGTKVSGQEVTKDEKTVTIKNVEGLHYAELDMSNVARQHNSEQKVNKESDTVYAELLI